MTVRLQPSGSLVAARKISELNMRADLVAVADSGIIDQMLIPRYATWNLELLANEIVIAHRDHSVFTDEISTQNWPEVLLRDKVRLGCTNPDTAPLGYRTLFVWQLHGRQVDKPMLADQLRERCADEHVAPDEGELVKLLEARAIDYAFIYRSTAESHHLKLTALPPEANLSRPQLTEHYRSAAVEVTLRSDQKKLLHGRPIVYGFTIPTNARNPQGAQMFSAFLLGEKGRWAFQRAGFHILSPLPCRGCTHLPACLRSFTKPTP